MTTNEKKCCAWCRESLADNFCCLPECRCHSEKKCECGNPLAIFFKRGKWVCEGHKDIDFVSSPHTDDWKEEFDKEFIVRKGGKKLLCEQNSLMLLVESFIEKLVASRLEAQRVEERLRAAEILSKAVLSSTYIPTINKLEACQKEILVDLSASIRKPLSD